MEIEMVLIDGIVIFVISSISIKIKPIGDVTKTVKTYNATGKRLTCNNNHVDIVTIIDTRD